MANDVAFGLPANSSGSKTSTLAPELRSTSAEFLGSFTAAAICRYIEGDGALNSSLYLDSVLKKMKDSRYAHVEARPHELIIDIPSEALAIRYFDPGQANQLTPYSYHEISKLNIERLNPRLRRQIIHRVKALPVPHPWDLEKVVFDQVDSGFDEWVRSGQIDAYDLRIIKMILLGDEAVLQNLLRDYPDKVGIKAEDKRNPDEDGRSVNFRLANPFPSPAGSISALRFKGVRPRHEDGTASVRSHTGDGFVDNPIVIDADGNPRIERIHRLPESDRFSSDDMSPQGAMLKSKADREYHIMKAGAAGIVFDTDYPIAAGVWKDKRHIGRTLGFVIAGMRSDDIRLTTRNMTSSDSLVKDVVTGDAIKIHHETRADIYEKMGRAIRAYHDAGYFHRYPHPGNWGVEIDRGYAIRVILRDLDKTIVRSEIGGKSMRRMEAAYRLVDIHRIISDLSGEGAAATGGRLGHMIEIISPLAKSFLKGYFHEIPSNEEEFSRLLEDVLSMTFAEMKIELVRGGNPLKLNRDTPTYGNIWARLSDLSVRAQKASDSASTETTSIYDIILEDLGLDEPSTTRAEAIVTEKPDIGGRLAVYEDDRLSRVVDPTTGIIWEEYFYRRDGSTKYVLLHNPVLGNKNMILFPEKYRENQGRVGRDIYRQEGDSLIRVGKFDMLESDRLRSFGSGKGSRSIFIDNVLVRGAQDKGESDTVLRWLALKACREHASIRTGRIMYLRDADFYRALFDARKLRIFFEELGDGGEKDVWDSAGVKSLREFLLYQTYEFDTKDRMQGSVRIGKDMKDADIISQCPQGYAPAIERGQLVMRDPDGQRVPVRYAFKSCYSWEGRPEPLRAIKAQLRDEERRRRKESASRTTRDPFYGKRQSSITLKEDAGGRVATYEGDTLMKIEDATTGIVWERYEYDGLGGVKTVDLWNPTAGNIVRVEACQDGNGLLQRWQVRQELSPGHYADIGHIKTLKDPAADAQKTGPDYLANIHIENESQGIATTLMRWMALCAWRGDKQLRLEEVGNPSAAIIASRLYATSRLTISDLSDATMEDMQAIRPDMTDWPGGTYFQRHRFANDEELDAFLLEQKYEFKHRGKMIYVTVTRDKENEVTIVSPGFPGGFTKELERGRLVVKDHSGKPVKLTYAGVFYWSEEVDEERVVRDQLRDDDVAGRVAVYQNEKLYRIIDPQSGVVWEEYTYGPDRQLESVILYNPKTGKRIKVETHNQERCGIYREEDGYAKCVGYAMGQLAAKKSDKYFYAKEIKVEPDERRQGIATVLNEWIALSAFRAGKKLRTAKIMNALTAGMCFRIYDHKGLKIYQNGWGETGDPFVTMKKGYRASLDGFDLTVEDSKGNVAMRSSVAASYWEGTVNAEAIIERQLRIENERLKKETEIAGQGHPAKGVDASRNPPGGGFKDPGAPLDAGTLLDIKEREPLWRKMAKAIEKPSSYEFGINGLDGKPQTVTLHAKVVYINDANPGLRMPDGINAWILGRGSDGKNDYIAIAIRGPAEKCAPFLNEILYHESRELYWLDTGLARREAHILAACQQSLAFNKNNKLTLCHKAQIDKMTPSQRVAILQEDASKRQQHYASIRQYLGEEAFEKYKEYERSVRRHIVSELLASGADAEVLQKDRKFINTLRMASIYSDVSDVTSMQEFIEFLESNWDTPKSLTEKADIYTLGRVLYKIKHKDIPFVRIDADGREEKIFIPPCVGMGDKESMKYAQSKRQTAIEIARQRLHSSVNLQSAQIVMEEIEAFNVSKKLLEILTIEIQRREVKGKFRKDGSAQRPIRYMVNGISSAGVGEAIDDSTERERAAKEYRRRLAQAGQRLEAAARSAEVMVVLNDLIGFGADEFTIILAKEKMRHFRVRELPRELDGLKRQYSRAKSEKTKQSIMERIRRAEEELVALTPSEARGQASAGAVEQTSSNPVVSANTTPDQNKGFLISHYLDLLPEADTPGEVRLIKNRLIELDASADDMQKVAVRLQELERKDVAEAGIEANPEIRKWFAEGGLLTMTGQAILRLPWGYAKFKARNMEDQELIRILMGVINIPDEDSEARYRKRVKSFLRSYLAQSPDNKTELFAALRSLRDAILLSDDRKKLLKKRFVVGFSKEDHFSDARALGHAGTFRGRAPPSIYLHKNSLLYVAEGKDRTETMRREGLRTLIEHENWHLITKSSPMTEAYVDPNNSGHFYQSKAEYETIRDFWDGVRAYVADDRGTAGPLKTLGPRLEQTTLSEIKLKESLWRAKAVSKPAKSYTFEINGRDGKKEKRTIRAQIAYISDDDRKMKMPSEITAWGLGKGADSCGECIIVAIRGPPKNIAPFLGEILYHEDHELYWKRKAWAEIAHILASCDQVMAFSDGKELTPLHTRQLEDMSDEDLRFNIEELDSTEVGYDRISPRSRYGAGRAYHADIVYRKLGGEAYKVYAQYQIRLKRRAAQLLLDRGKKSPTVNPAYYEIRMFDPKEGIDTSEMLCSLCEKSGMLSLVRGTILGASADVRSAGNLLGQLRQRSQGVIDIQEFLRTKLGSVSGGYALGVNRAYFLNERSDVYALLARFSGLASRQAAYSQEGIGAQEHARTNKLLDIVIGYNKPIVFFVPNKLIKDGEPDYDYDAEYAHEEMVWMFNHPDRLNNVLFVLGAYTDEYFINDIYKAAYPIADSDERIQFMRDRLAGDIAGYPPRIDSSNSGVAGLAQDDEKKVDVLIKELETMALGSVERSGGRFGVYIFMIGQNRYVIDRDDRGLTISWTHEKTRKVERFFVPIHRQATCEKLLKRLDEKLWPGAVLPYESAGVETEETVLTSEEKGYILNRILANEPGEKQQLVQQGLEAAIKGKLLSERRYPFDFKNADVLLVPGFSTSGFLFALYSGARSVTVFDIDPVLIAWQKAIKRYFNYKPDENAPSLGEQYLKCYKFYNISKEIDGFDALVDLIVEAVEKDPAGCELDKKIFFYTGDARDLEKDKRFKRKFDAGIILYLFPKYFVNEKENVINQRRAIESMKSLITDNGRVVVVPENCELKYVKQYSMADEYIEEGSVDCSVCELPGIDTHTTHEISHAQWLGDEKLRNRIADAAYRARMTGLKPGQNYMIPDAEILYVGTISIAPQGGYLLKFSNILTGDTIWLPSWALCLTDNNKALEASHRCDEPDYDAGKFSVAQQAMNGMSDDDKRKALEYVSFSARISGLIGTLIDNGRAAVAGNLALIALKNRVGGAASIADIKRAVNICFAKREFVQARELVIGSISNNVDGLNGYQVRQWADKFIATNTNFYGEGIVAAKKTVLLATEKHISGWSANEILSSAEIFWKPGYRHYAGELLTSALENESEGIWSDESQKSIRMWLDRLSQAEEFYWYGRVAIAVMKKNMPCATLDDIKSAIEQCDNPKSAGELAIETLENNLGIPSRYAIDAVSRCYEKKWNDAARELMRTMFEKGLAGITGQDVLMWYEHAQAYERVGVAALAIANGIDVVLPEKEKKEAVLRAERLQLKTPKQGQAAPGPGEEDLKMSIEELRQAMNVCFEQNDIYKAQKLAVNAMANKVKGLSADDISLWMARFLDHYAYSASENISPARQLALGAIESGVDGLTQGRVMAWADWLMHRGQMDIAADVIMRYSEEYFARTQTDSVCYICGNMIAQFLADNDILEAAMNSDMLTELLDSSPVVFRNRMRQMLKVKSALRSAGEKQENDLAVIFAMDMYLPGFAGYVESFMRREEDIAFITQYLHAIRDALGDESMARDLRKFIMEISRDGKTANAPITMTALLRILNAANNIRRSKKLKLLKADIERYEDKKVPSVLYRSFEKEESLAQEELSVGNKQVIGSPRTPADMELGNADSEITIVVNDSGGRTAHYRDQKLWRIVDPRSGIVWEEYAYGANGQPESVLLYNPKTGKKIKVKAQAQERCAIYREEDGYTTCVGYAMGQIAVKKSDKFFYAKEIKIEPDARRQGIATVLNEWVALSAFRAGKKLRTARTMSSIMAEMCLRIYDKQGLKISRYDWFGAGPSVVIMKSKNKVSLSGYELIVEDTKGNVLVRASTGACYWEGKVNGDVIIDRQLRMENERLKKERQGQQSEDLSAYLEYIDKNQDFIKSLLEQDKEGALLRIPVDLLGSTGKENARLVMSELRKAPNMYIELFNNAGAELVDESIYREYGLERKPRPAHFKMTRDNTITLFSAVGEDAKTLTGSSLSSRIGGVNPKETILSPVGSHDDPAGLIRSIILGLKIMDLARQIWKKQGKYVNKEGLVDEGLAQLEILEQIKGLLNQEALKDTKLNVEDIVALAVGNNFNRMVAALKRLIELLPVTPIETAELQKIYERAKTVITNA